MEQSFSIFGNIKRFLLGLLAGSVGFSLLVPRTLNQLTELFGISYECSYWIFITLYFVLPFLYLLIFAFAKKGLALNQIFKEGTANTNLRYLSMIIGGSLCLMVLVGLTFTNAILDYVFCWLAAILSIAFIMYALFYSFTTTSGNRYPGLRDYEFILLVMLSGSAAVLFISKEAKDNKTILFVENNSLNHSLILKRYALFQQVRKVIIEDLPPLEDSLRKQMFSIQLEDIFNNHALVPGNKSSTATDTSYIKRLELNLSVKKPYLDSLRELKSFLAASKFKNSDFAGESVIISAQHFRNLLNVSISPPQKTSDVTHNSASSGTNSVQAQPASKSATKSNDATSNKKLIQNSAFSTASSLNSVRTLDTLDLQLKVIKAYLNYSLLIGKEWENYIKGNWIFIVQKMQFKGLLWFFTLYFFSIASLYVISQRWHQLNDKQNERLIQEVDSNNTSIQTFTERELHTVWLKKQLSRTSGNDGPGKLEQLSGMASGIKGFIIGLVTLITPFFQHLSKEDINLEKPFLNYDLAALTGVEALSQDYFKPLKPGFPSGTTLIDSSAIHWTEGNTVAYLFEKPADIETVLKAVEELSSRVDDAYAMNLGLIEYLTDGHTNDRIKILEKRNRK